MFSNESQTLCDSFHNFKQNISFCVTDIHVPVGFTKPKPCFQNCINIPRQKLSSKVKPVY